MTKLKPHQSWIIQSRIMAVRVRSGPRPYRKAEIFEPGRDSNWKIRLREPLMRMRVWE
jgi:hypothetical protein